jgi:hypothetical protein
MEITQLAAKPQLVKITLNEKEITEKYGDSLDFYVWDRQPLDRFVELATAKETEYGKIVAFMEEAILDKDANPVCKDGMTLPADVMLMAMNKVTETLGK